VERGEKSKIKLTGVMEIDLGEGGLQRREAFSSWIGNVSY